LDPEDPVSSPPSSDEPLVDALLPLAFDPADEPLVPPPLADVDFPVAAVPPPALDPLALVPFVFSPLDLVPLALVPLALAPVDFDGAPEDLPVDPEPPAFGRARSPADAPVPFTLADADPLPAAGGGPATMPFRKRISCVPIRIELETMKYTLRIAATFR